MSDKLSSRLNFGLDSRLNLPSSPPPDNCSIRSSLVAKKMINPTLNVNIGSPRENRARLDPERQEEELRKLVGEVRKKGMEDCEIITITTTELAGEQQRLQE